ncbi:MAG: sensor domain-containing protein [Cellvibrionaceae bacterium]
MARKLGDRRFGKVFPSRSVVATGDRRWARKILRDSGQEKLLELMNAASQGILIHDYDFSPLFVNRSYATTVGYSVEEILSLDYVDRLYPSNEERRLKGYLQARLQKFSKTSPPTVYEVEVCHKDGQTIILQHSVSLIDWKGLPAVLISAIDITEQYLSQQALELSEERFRDFAESASDWCWEMDDNLRFSYMSDSFERNSGYKISEVIGFTRKEFVEKHSPADSLTLEEKQQWDDHAELLDRHESFSNFEYRWRHPNGSTIILSASGKPIFSSTGKFCGYRGTASNITDERQLSEKLSFQATHDELTGLINRRHFDSELHNTIDDAHINNAEHALVFMDLDRFKIVNDTCGHMAGDELLQQLAGLFKKVFSKRDVLGRLGGDEFAVIMRNCTVKQSTRITERLHNEIDRFRFVWDGKSFTIGVSIGVVGIDKHSDSVSRLLQNVDSACYVAKETGRNKTHIFSENDEDLSKRQGEMHWAARITQALEEDDFTLYAQPMLPLNTSGGVFYELLIRMKDGESMISPRVFLPAAERYDLSLNIDKWVLCKALEWVRDHPHVLSKTQLIFINLSGKTIGKKTFQEYAIKQLQRYGVPPEKICFEITETTAIANLAEAVNFINKLKETGCFFALDDFGSGVSSFAYLKNLPVDYLKIDGMFIRDMSVNEVNLAMVKSINEISHVMGKKTIAEFVEDDSTFALLRNMGIDYAQGYAIGHPVPLEELSENQPYYLHD